MNKVKLYVVLLLFTGAMFSCEDHLTEKELGERGDLIAASTAQELSGNLMSKMKEGGIPLAVEYCNTAAIPMTDSLSKTFGAVIKRTSLKTRNPMNRPSDDEKALLEKFEMDHKNGEPLKIVVRVEGDSARYYKPILIEKKCLMCHGNLNKELSRPADSIIKSLYPKDLATGYTDGDLRGMWSISFPKK